MTAAFATDANRQTPAARVQDHRPHMDCGAQLRLAWAQSTIEQGLRVVRAELRDTHRNRRNTPYAQPPRSGMRLFKHALRLQGQVLMIKHFHLIATIGVSRRSFAGLSHSEVATPFRDAHQQFGGPDNSSS
jgi:hypothetical protein